MAWSCAFKELIKDSEIGKRFVPIIPTRLAPSGWTRWFPTQKIYNPRVSSTRRWTVMLVVQGVGHRPDPARGHQRGWVGRVIQRAGSSYSTHDEPMIPVYIFYSMFGFQRTGDQLWACMDQKVRGFLLGATVIVRPSTVRVFSTRTGTRTYWRRATRRWSPTTRRSPSRSGTSSRTVCAVCTARTRGHLYYLTVYNEPVVQPAEPEGVDVEGILGDALVVARRR